VADLVVENIGELVTAAGPDAGDGALGLVHHAAVAIRDGRVVFAGAAAALPANLDAPRLDAGGRLVTPGLVDPHTHLLFAGSRAHEFDLRNQGRPYLEIQAAGGGILATVTATRAASDEALLDAAVARLDRFLTHGVTVVECKSGYDLTIDGELRLLRLYDALRRRHPIDLSPTLLAHVPPPDVDAAGRADFVRRLCDEAIPTAARTTGCEAVDVYCDAGAFTLDETRAILAAARRHRFALRVHAEQFTHTGAAELAASLGAASVEHLEQLGADAPAQLAAAGTVCNLLPGAALTLKLPWPDAGRLYAAGCAVALGTDCNPGSSLTESQPLMMSLACTQMGLSAAQAWSGVTRAAARALGRNDCGRLAPDSRGDLVVWDADDHRQIPQHLGASLARTVVVRGAVAYDR
jgi:imidazolonepropionase